MQTKLLWTPCEQIYKMGMMGMCEMTVLPLIYLQVCLSK